VCNYHPKLISIAAKQTPRAMLAMIIVSSVYFWVFFDFVPLNILVIWFSFQIFLGVFRLYNAAAFKKTILSNDIVEMKRQQFYFLLSNIFQAFMWTSASILCVIYAPPPFELVTFSLIIGILTAAVLSMSPIYYAYLTFFFFMIIPQIMIMIYYGEHQHIALIIFTLIYIPATILLSKSLYNSQLASIEAHDALELNMHELHKLSTIDSLTNIYNRRYFFEMAQSLISISLREEKTVSLLMFDIDLFKRINDIYGHHAGDFILISFTEEVKKIMRQSDIFARVGGEEFTVLLPNTSLNGAKVIAEKIRKSIEEKVFIYNETPLNITVSIGTASSNKENISIEELYQKADEQLYRAKKDGRNRVY
jgi:diguanylate cyclase (GGDEF)-like protein